MNVHTFTPHCTDTELHKHYTAQILYCTYIYCTYIYWTDHLERMDNTGLPKHALTYKPRGRRDRGRPRKRWQRVDAGTGQTT